jgi:hypothetical protein
MTAVDIRSQHVRERSSRAIDHALLPVKIYLPVYWYEIGPGKKGRIRKLATYAVTAYTENGVRYVDRAIRDLIQSLDRV